MTDGHLHVRLLDAQAAEERKRREAEAKAAKMAANAEKKAREAEEKAKFASMVAATPWGISLERVRSGR